MTLSEKLYKILIRGGSWKTILGGLRVTVKISVFALLIGTVLGALVCQLRIRKNPLARFIASVYIAVLRGTPVLMLLLLLYYGVLARAGLKPVTVAVITFALNVSAHVAELLRAALDATDKGQAEAARTLGFSAWDTSRFIILPQVLRIAKPVYQSTIVNLIQWTSVVGYVTITDLTRVINNIKQEQTEEQSALMKAIGGGIGYKKGQNKDIPEGTITTQTYYNDLLIAVALK